jgi:uncharacterized protein with von Willebrand factor type A (vWA) domain
MSGRLAGNLILFGRVLRGLGLDAGPGRMIGLAAALEHVSVGSKRDFYYASRAFVARRREDLALFDRAFEAFWRKPAGAATSLDLAALGEKRRLKRPAFERESPLGDAARGASASPDEARPRTVFRATSTWSAREALRHKDFAELSAEELEEVREAIRAQSWEAAERATRRRRAGEGPDLDWRRTLRRSLRHGGEILAFARREPRRRPRPLVVLCDISGSMERYTRLLLLFLYSLARGLDRRVEVFLFGTRLTRVTRAICAKDPDAALAEVSRVVPDWSGGTRIGAALSDFNLRWARRVLGGGAIVLLISDGWDRGEPEVLARETARLQRSCHRLVWLNPLLGSPSYEPLARGMRAALPHVDDFLPVHDLASLEALGRRLEAIPASRPARRQRPAGAA